jgi:hypothetical protein
MCCVAELYSVLFPILREPARHRQVSIALPTVKALLRRPLVRSVDGGDVALQALAALSRYVDLLDIDAVMREFVQHSALFVLLLNPSPCGRTMRALAELLVKLARKIGIEHCIEHLLPYLTQFYANYNEFYELTRDGNVLTKSIGVSGATAQRQWTREIYSSEMIALLYVPVRDLVTANVVRREISNSILLEAIVKHRLICFCLFAQCFFFFFLRFG